MANFNINKTIIGGHLTAEPELKQTPSGIMVLSFAIAVNRKHQPKGETGQQSQTISDFINCVAWRNNAEFIARYFHKGSSICVAGNIQTRTWTDQQNAKRYATEVVVDEVFFVDSKADGGTLHAGTPAAAMPPGGIMGAPNFEVIEGDDEIPF